MDSCDSDDSGEALALIVSSWNGLVRFARDRYREFGKGAIVVTCEETSLRILDYIPLASSLDGECLEIIEAIMDYEPDYEPQDQIVLVLKGSHGGIGICVVNVSGLVSSEYIN